MTKWSGLRWWQESAHKKIAISLWKTESGDQLQKHLLNEMKCIYDVDTKLPGIIKYTDSYEHTRSANAISNGHTQYKEEDVSYTINDYGFRGKWRLEDRSKPSLAAFGCSFTFGIGIADQDLYVNKMAAHLDCLPYNLGVPGGSMDKATRFYARISEYQHFDYVVFLIPTLGRMEIPNTSNNKPTLDLIPNWTSINMPDERRRKAIYSVLDDNFFEYSTIANVNSCIQIAKRHNTQIYFSSWDMPTYDLIYDYLGKDSGHLLPFFEILQLGTNMARDGTHPGPDSHSNFFERSVAYI